MPQEERFKAPISRLFDWDRINRLKLIEQADVLMLLFLFPNAFSAEVVEANYRYTSRITDHGSSLSPGIHAAIAARLGFRSDAERYWRESLWLDLSNGMGNSALGIHPACMGAPGRRSYSGFSASPSLTRARAARRMPARGFCRIGSRSIWSSRGAAASIVPTSQRSPSDDDVLVTPGAARRLADGGA